MRVIEVLSREKYISGNEIGEMLGISRAAVHKQINNLRKNGYIIESSPKGYRLAENPGIFSREAIMANIKKPLSLCGEMFHYQEIPSTQTKIKTLAEKNYPEGTIVIANKQTAAYGRLQRSWSSGDGGLWFSLLLRPKINPEHASKLPLLLGISLNRILKKEYKISTEIKWSNDVLHKDKKISGIIIEMSAEQDMIKWVAAGIGINVNNVLPKELTDAASLKSISGTEINRSKLFALLLTEFNGIYRDFTDSGFKKFVREYNSSMAYMRENVIINNGFDIIKGVNEGVDESGRIMISNAGKTERVISGTLRKNNI